MTDKFIKIEEPIDYILYENKELNETTNHITKQTYLNEESMKILENDDDIKIIDSLENFYKQRNDLKGEVDEEKMEIQTKQELESFINKLKRYMGRTGTIIILIFSSIAGVGVIVGSATGLYKLVKAISVKTKNNEKSKIYYYINK